MGVWSEFLKVTIKLDDAVHQQVDERNRAAVVAELEEHLATRESMLELLDQPNEREKAIVQEVHKRDLKINQKLEFLFDGLKRDIRNAKKQKSSKQRYVNPYQSVSGYDGMYLDHKK